MSKILSASLFHLVERPNALNQDDQPLGSQMLGQKVLELYNSSVLIENLMFCHKIDHPSLNDFCSYQIKQVALK